MGSNANKQNFEPLTLMGIFWTVFGVLILVATFFISETPLVPHTRGIITNVIAGLILLLVGVFSVVRGRRKGKAK